MSHVAKYSTKLGSVIPNLFTLAVKAAMEELAAETAGEVVSFVSEGNYDKTEVIAGVKNKEYRSGIGFRLNKDTPELCVEAYHQKSDHSNIENRVNQYYMVLATELVLRHKGYNVKKQRNSDGSWELVGESEELA